MFTLVGANDVSKVLAEFIVNMVSSLYNTVGHLYNFMSDMLTGTMVGSGIITSITSTIYVLIGVFMLFRVTITAINYLINPDAVNDKSAGAGKMITRIIISLVLLLTLNSFIYPLLNDIQTVLVKPDGLISKLFNYDASSDDEGNDSLFFKNAILDVTDEVVNESGIFDKVEKVNAASSLTCYYLLIDSKGVGSNNPFDSKLGSKTLVRIDFQFKKEDGKEVVYAETKEDSTKIIEDSNGEKIELNFLTFNIDNNSKPTLDSFLGTTETNRSFDSSYGVWVDHSKCPTSLYNTKDQSNGSINTQTYPGQDNDLEIGEKLSGLKYGTNNINEIIERYKDAAEDRNEFTPSTTPEGGNYDKTPGRAEGEGLTFSRSVAKSFQYCNLEDDSACKSIQDNMFQSVLADRDLIDAVKKGDITIDLFISIIVALALIIYIILLIVDIIIRNLKIMILQMLAPIAVVSYVDPKDKVFNNWVKAYSSAYLDLFLKLVAINLVINLLKIYHSQSASLGAWGYLAYIFALFTFAKTLPNYISKIFGIEGMGGSFKDTMSGLKTAVGIGAGAAIGGAVGMATGFGKGVSASTVLGGLAGGMFRGAQGGAKGNIMSGATTQIGRNKQARQSNANGGNWWERQKAKVGMDSASMIDRNVAELEDKNKLYDGFSSYVKEAEDAAEASNFMKNLRAMKTAHGNPRYSEEDLKSARDNWINAQMTMKNSNGTITSQSVQVGNNFYTADYEAGKASGISAAIDKAEATRSGSAILREVVGDAPITSFGELDSANKNVKQAKTANEIEIIRQKSTDEYRAGDASRNIGKSGK